MKTTNFFIIAAIACAMLAGCSKDNDNKNAYTYDGKTFKIAWAGYYYNENEGEVPGNGGYCFGISSTIPAGPLYSEDNFFEVDYPEPLLGQKANLSTSYENWWSLYGYLKNIGYSYYFEEGDDGSNDLSGTDNWVKVTKNSGEGNFTLEFGMTINGKRLTGSYTGKFKKCANYGDVGICG